MTERYCRLHDLRACGILRHPGTHAWLIVRGPDDPRENPSDTVIREFGEELDVAVAIEPRMRAVSWTEPSNPGPLGKVTFVFDLGFLPIGAVITPDSAEIAAWAWVPQGELGDRLHPFDAERAAAVIAEDGALPISYIEQRRTPAEAVAAAGGAASRTR